MSLLRRLFVILSNLTLFVLIVAIVIPIRYGSTDPQYLGFRLLHSVLSLKHSLIPDPTRPTLSADYRAIESLLRMKPVANIDPSADAVAIINEARISFTFGKLLPKPSQCQVDKEVFDHDGHAVDTYWVNYPPKIVQKNSDRILIYLHGGGYVLGDIDSYSGFECHLSELFNMTVLHVEYRLSPEHPLPAAVEDTLAVYRALLQKNISPSQLLLMGDSAGGGLSLLTIQSVLEQQLPLPRGVITISPWADLSSAGESYQRNRPTDVLLSYDSLVLIVTQVLGANHAQLSSNSSKFSPLFGSFERFPPLYITVGTAEILEDDSRLLLKKTQDAGVDVTFEEGLHLMHVYPIFFPYYPEARTTLDNINQWIQTIFNDQQQE